MTARVFASTFTYPYTKLHGEAWVQDALKRGEGFPAARTLHELGRIEPATTFYQTGTTLITQARSKGAGEFLRSGADVWVSWDDDCYADGRTLARFIRACSLTRGLVAAPTITRTGNVPTFRLHGDSAWDAGRIREVEGDKLYPVQQVSFTLFAVHRNVVERLSGAVPWCLDKQRDRWYPALFLEGAIPPEWVSEDVGFCLAMRRYPDMPCYVMLEASVEHAGDEVLLGADGQLVGKAATIARLESLPALPTP